MDLFRCIFAKMRRSENISEFGEFDYAGESFGATSRRQRPFVLAQVGTRSDVLIQATPSSTARSVCRHFSKPPFSNRLEMADTTLIAPIVVAIVGLVGSALSLYLNWRNQRKQQERAAIQATDLEAFKGKQTTDLESLKSTLNKDLEDFKLQLSHNRTVANLTDKYSQPLLVAAYDLQQRLYDLVEYPISRQHLEKKEGLDDLKIFTCFLLAQYLALTHILRTKTNYLSFVKNDKLKQIRKLMYMIDEELDRRRDAEGNNVGVWPAARLLVCERMMVSGGDSVVGVHDSLDGGFGVEIKGFDRFYAQWETHFQKPMGYFCEWIDRMLVARLSKGRTPHHNDAPMRCLQHLLVDLVTFLDNKQAYISQGPKALKCKESWIYCDCEAHRTGDLDDALKFRQDSRWNDSGIWAYRGLISSRPKGSDGIDGRFDLEAVKSMTYTVDLT